MRIHSLFTCLLQVHLLKLFDNVKSFVFSRDGKSIASLMSTEGEGFSLSEPAPVDGPVESWMLGAEAAMRSSLHALTKAGIYHYARTARLAWVAEQLGMITLAGSQVRLYLCM